METNKLLIINYKHWSLKQLFETINLILEANFYYHIILYSSTTMFKALNKNILAVLNYNDIIVTNIK